MHTSYKHWHTQVQLCKNDDRNFIVMRVKEATEAVGGFALMQLDCPALLSMVDYWGVGCVLVECLSLTAHLCFQYQLLVGEP